ncbi:MAG TPA: ParB/RepB/Spo0J family partition protein [Flavobacteriales bacterium]|nr:ParB/RepB/Spo0J family partition protein [Flavobacteriales bacterium]
MTSKRNALGKGLGALLENYETDVTSKASSVDNPDDAHQADVVVGSVANLPLDAIEANPFQPRTKFEAEKLEELASSIKKHKLIQPITVRKMGYDQYQLISGERRFKAARIAGLKSIPAYLRIANDQEMLELALVENIQRQDLNALEIAFSYQRLIEECNLTQEELSENIGKNRTTISNYLRLLKLPDIIQAAIKDDNIQMGHARALINIENEADQISIFNKTILKSLSVRQVEDLVRNLSDGNHPVGKRKIGGSLSVEHKKLAYKLSTHFDTKVELKRYNNKTGKIVIPFSSDEDLSKIIKAIDLD